MTLYITIECDNAAFDRSLGKAPVNTHEVERLLHTIPKRMRQGEDSGKLMDINGNSVGKFELIKD